VLKSSFTNFTTQILKGWKRAGKELEKSWNFDGLLKAEIFESLK